LELVLAKELEREASIWQLQVEDEQVSAAAAEVVESWEFLLGSYVEIELLRSILQ
jgi:hypothetical protein